MESAKLERINVVADGRIKATFTDESILLLTADGKAFVYVAPDGSFVRHLTKYALHRHQVKLQEVLKFRNLYFRESFYDSWVLDDEISRRKISLHHEWSPHWPLTEEEANKHQLIQSSEDHTCVFTHDRRAHLVLDHLGHRISTRSPLHLLSDDKGCILEDKVFAINDCPSEWQHPLHLTLGVTQQVTQLENTRVAVRRSDSDSFPQRSWWFRYTSVLPTDEIVLMEWTPEAFFLHSTAEEECHIWVFVDDSYLISKQKGKYLEHQRRFPHREALYHASAMPLFINNDDNKPLYCLSKLADRCIALRTHCCKLQPKGQVSVSPVAPLSVEILVERKTAEGLFTAYVDGRIRARFTDRTILNTNCDQSECTLILPDGQITLIPNEQTDDTEEYLYLAMQFSKWAFSFTREH